MKILILGGQGNLGGNYSSFSRDFETNFGDKDDVDVLDYASCAREDGSLGRNNHQCCSYKRRRPLRGREGFASAWTRTRVSGVLADIAWNTGGP
jgi:hypothetical protein